MEQPHPPRERAGLVAGLSAVARNLFALFVTRAELAALELGEARDHLAKLFLVGALGVLLVCFALAGWTALIVVLAWDALGWKILLLVAVVYTLLAGAALLAARSMLAQDKLGFPATMAELRNDREALF
ncbi:MAG TPA: phage holin family protein [Noviherbaspirillum sp.]|nr:phage holin family protein [Noviherbaspirillum sp.]